MGSKQKTVYVGKGLGFKHNERLDSELHSILNKGSAKSLLKQILNEEEDDSWCLLRQSSHVPIYFILRIRLYNICEG